MDFRHTRSGAIRINDVVYTEADVLVAVPAYALPIPMTHADIDGLINRTFDSSGSQYRAEAAYVVLAEAAVNNLAAIQKAKADREAAVIENEAIAQQARIDALPLDERKRRFYDANGQTESAFIRALIQERSPENDSVPINDFFAKRAETRARSEFPS